MKERACVAIVRCAAMALATVAFWGSMSSRLALALGASDAAESDSGDPNFDRGFATSPLWDDAKAEVSRYGGRVVRQGVARDAEWIVILRRERQRAGTWVASDDADAPSTVEVLKVDELFTVQTGVSTERQMLSSILTRRDLVPVRTVFSSQDWLGQTWKEVTRSAGVPVELQYSSYWDREGRGTRMLDAKGALLFDDLVILLRTLRRDSPPSISLDVIPSLISSRVGDTARESARIETRRGETLRTAGRNWKARRSDVHRREGVDTFWFDDDDAGPLLRWRKSDGTTWSLIETSRVAHWKWAHPGDSLDSATEAGRAAPVIPPAPR